MDKQPKLIDADKLLKAIAEKKTEHEKYREKLGVDHLYFEFHEGAVTTLEWIEKEINLGNFGSDPIPPTIKQGDTRGLLHNIINVITDEQACILAKSLGLEVSRD